MKFDEVRARVYRRPENDQLMIELVCEDYSTKELIEELRLKLLSGHVLRFSENRTCISGESGFVLEAEKRPSGGITTGAY